MSIIILPPERRTPEAVREVLRNVLWEYRKMRGSVGRTSENPVPAVIHDAEDVLWGWKIGRGDLR